jgi:hypothetical protein
MSASAAAPERTRRRFSRTLSPSRWAEYRRLLLVAETQDYAIVPLERWLEDPDAAGGRPALVLRHDVDQHPMSAMRMAAIEADHGITSTWYFRWRTADAEVIGALREQGHAVGLHYETLTRLIRSRRLSAADAPALLDEARVLLRRELSAFEERFGPCRSACPHGDTRVPGVHNGVLLAGEDWDQYGLRWDANAALGARRLDVWLTDRSAAEGHWKDGLDPIDLMLDRRQPILAVIHPNNWVSGLALWVDRILPGPQRTGTDAPPPLGPLPVPSGHARLQTPQA